MTSSGRGHPFAVAAWILMGALVVAGVAGVLGGILSPSLVVDVVALWPLFAIALVAGALVTWRAKSRRSAAILPLALITASVLTGALHIGGWDQLPSATARLTGPDRAELSDPTELVAQVSGRLELSSVTGEAAYLIDPILLGGSTGVPQATETSVDGAMSVRVEADPDAPGWYAFAGWRIGLNPDVVWRLVLNGEIDADLTALVLSSAAIAGSGSLRLGQPPDEDVSIIVAGDFEVSVPPGAPVAVRGEAQVPANWEKAHGLASSPSLREGDAWRISVQGDATPVIREG